MKKIYYFIKINSDVTNEVLKRILESKGLTQNYDVCDFDWLEEGFFVGNLIFVYGNEYFDGSDDIEAMLSDYFMISESIEDVKTILLSEL